MRFQAFTPANIERSRDNSDDERCWAIVREGGGVHEVLAVSWSREVAGQIHEALRAAGARVFVQPCVLVEEQL